MREPVADSKKGDSSVCRSMQGRLTIVSISTLRAADADSQARRCRSSARHDKGLEGHRHHPSQSLQGALSERRSELRDRNEDCRCIRYAERASGLSGARAVPVFGYYFGGGGGGGGGFGGPSVYQLAGNLADLL